MVEWRELQKEMKVLRGKRLTKSLLDENASYPVFHGGIEPLGRFSEYNRDENTVMVINVGASAGTVGFCNSRFWSSDGCFCISHSNRINSRFLYYFMLGKTHYLQSQVRYAGIPTLDNSVIEKILIPIPTLSEQTRIVGILDTFTASIENLKQQIAERRKQYEHYRDQLLKHVSKECPIVTLKDVAIIKNGKDYKNLSNGDVPVYGSGGIMTYVDQYASDRPSVLLPRKGSVENVFYVDKPFWTVDTLYWTEIDTNKVLPKYLFVSLKRYNLKDYAYGGARPSLSQPILYKLEIPQPSLQEQSRIVSILDTFEASIANLEAQLKEREKQYEYYRNKLLTFE